MSYPPPKPMYKRKGKSTKITRSKNPSNKQLVKAVKALEYKVNQKQVFLNYQQSFSTGVTADCTVFKLSNFSNWSAIFGSDANDGNGNAIIHKGFGLDMYLSLENTLNEPDTTMFTIFLVSLKDEYNSNSNNFNNVTGDITIAPGFHYAVNGGLVMLNKKVFNIHAIKRRVLTNHGTALTAPSAQTQGGTDFRCYIKHRVNKKIVAPYGDWKSLACPGDPSKNYFLMVFNDNSSLDLQNPLMKINVVHTVEQLA